jgi:glyoxylase-like metal-dependent hydrolase (beta-lactamase superfamily II)
MAIVGTVDSFAENPVRTVICTHYQEDHLGARVMGHEHLAAEVLCDTTIAAIQKLQPAHSRTDIAVLIPAANVLHAGDLIEVGAYPFIDWWAGGSLEGMIQEVDRSAGWAQGDQRIVPGHGPVIGAAELAEYEKMLVTVRGRARAALERGDTEEQFLDSRPTREFDAGRGGEAAGRQFASLVWYGLSRGD